MFQMGRKCLLSPLQPKIQHRYHRRRAWIVSFRSREFEGVLGLLFTGRHYMGIQPDSSSSRAREVRWHTPQITCRRICKWAQHTCKEPMFVLQFNRSWPPCDTLTACSRDFISRARKDPCIRTDRAGVETYCCSLRKTYEINGTERSISFIISWTDTRPCAAAFYIPHLYNFAHPEGIRVPSCPRIC